MVQLPTYRYPEVEDRLAVFAQMKEALEAIPGVEAVSGTSSLPFSGIPNLLSFGILGKPDPGEGSRHATQESVVPGFLEVMGIPLLAGRALNRGDLAGGAKVTVVSESTARRFWPGESPLGASLDFGDTLMVVGIAGDVRHESLDAEVLPTMYLPLASGYYYSNGRSQLSFVVRTEEDPERFFPQARRAVWSVDAEAPIRRVAMVSNLIARSEQDGRFRTVLMMVFGICAACLAGAGIFGTTARAVSLRSREMGIRKALGAGVGTLVRSVLTRSVALGVVGVGLGLAGALGASLILGEYLFGIEPWDPLTYGVVAAGTLAFSVLASYLPARRVNRLTPMQVLREE
jgi:putative ABC transport system permease protein